MFIVPQIMFVNFRFIFVNLAPEKLHYNWLIINGRVTIHVMLKSERVVMSTPWSRTLDRYFIVFVSLRRTVIDVVDDRLLDWPVVAWKRMV